MMELELPPELHDVSSDQLRLDIARLCHLVDMGYEVDGEAVLSESLWVVYGRSSYDGEVILAEYTHPAQAAAVLQGVPTTLR
jgi:hypothetical protein